MHWFNHDRIHSYLNDASPDQFEAASAASHTDQTTVGIDLERFIDVGEVGSDGPGFVVGGEGVAGE